MTSPRSLLLTLALVGILSWLAACTQPGPVLPTFEVVPHKPETAIAYRMEGDAVIFDIFSQSGIGGADVSLTSGTMPDQMLLRFHLKGLESLQFTYRETAVSPETEVSPEIVISLAVSSSGAHDARETVMQGDDSVQETSLTPDSPYWMDVSIIAAEGATASIPLDGYFEVTPPADFLQGDYHDFTLEWIDFYR